MALYIKKEMADLHGKGSTGAYYRLKTWRKLEFDEFVKRCHNLHRVYDKSVIEGVVMAVCEHIAYELGNGYCVKIKGLGTFNARLGVREDKEMDGFEEGTQKRNAQSIEVSGISFRADKELIRETDRNCNLERGGESRLRKSKYTEEERIERARQYLRENGYMRVFNYASLTGLSYTTASRELRRIASNPSTGIISRGRKSAKLYLLAPESQKNM
jgi:predicted histone-like DNA-binding protein